MGADVGKSSEIPASDSPAIEDCCRSKRSFDDSTGRFGQMKKTTTVHTLIPFQDKFLSYCTNQIINGKQTFPMHFFILLQNFIVDLAKRTNDCTHINSVPEYICLLYCTHQIIEGKHKHIPCTFVYLYNLFCSFGQTNKTTVHTHTHTHTLIPFQIKFVGYYMNS